MSDKKSNAMGGMPGGQVVVNQQPTLKGQMSAPAPTPSPGASATAGGVQQMTQQNQVAPAPPMQPQGAPVAMPGQATPSGWVGNPLAPSGQGPVTGQVPPINQQPPMFKQNPMQKLSMADAAKAFTRAGSVKLAYGSETALAYGLLGSAYGAGNAGQGRRVRGGLSGGIRGLATGAGVTLGGAAGDTLANSVMQSGDSPGRRALAIASMLGGRVGGGVAGYKLTGGVPKMFGLNDDEEMFPKYGGFGCHNVNGPMVGTPAPPPQPKVVTPKVESKRIDPSALFKQARFGAIVQKMLPMGKRLGPTISAAKQIAGPAAQTAQAAPGLMGHLRNGYDKAMQMYSRIPKGIRSPVGGYVTGSFMGEGVDQGASALGIDTGGWGSTVGGMLGAGSRMPWLRRAVGAGSQTGQAMRKVAPFFTEGGNVSNTARNVRRGLMGTAVGMPIAKGVADNYVNGQIENLSQQAGFGSGAEGMEFMQNLNAGNLAPVIKHMWGRLSPHQQMALIGGGGSMLAGALGGATGLTGGGTTAGLMGAGALGLGLGTGFIPGLGGNQTSAQQGAPYSTPQPNQQASAQPAYQPRNEYAMQAEMA